MQMKKVASMVLMSALFLTGCGSSGTQTTQTPTEEETPSTSTTLSGTIAISGSTSTEKIVKAVADEYMAMNQDVEITYEGIGSSAGVKNAINGVSDIGTASREIKSDEKESGLTEQVLAYDGIAAIVHPNSGVETLSMEQLTAIYSGEITNWSEVGGADQSIVVVSREDGSGTRGAFEELLSLDGITQDAMIKEGNGNVQTTVAGNPQAIGYVSFTYINDTIKAVSINGVEPTIENTLAGDYKLSRPFIMVYFEDKITDLTRDFLEFTTTAAGKEIIEENGGIVE